MTAIPELAASPAVPGRIHRIGFGWINVGGRRYEQDRILHPAGVSGPWWRQRRHHLDTPDAEALLAAYAPEHVIVGCGWMGMLVVEPGFERALREAGVYLEVHRTREAMLRYELLRPRHEALVALFHLTC